MGSPDLWQRIHELYVRDIFVGLRLDKEGVQVWMTDRHFSRRADCQIDKGPGLVMAQEIQRWLDEQAPKMRGGNVMLNYAQNTIGSSRRL